MSVGERTSELLGVGGASQTVQNRQAEAGRAERAGVDSLAAGHVELAHGGEETAGDPFQVRLAPEPRDVHNPKRWEGKIHFSEPERAAFREVIGVGLKDAFRLFEQPDKQFTWWDYRLKAFERGWGLRIDHILLSPSLAPRCTSCSIDIEPRKRERPSDHAPVIAALDL